MPQYHSTFLYKYIDPFSYLIDSHTFYHKAGSSEEFIQWRRIGGSPTIDDVSVKRVGGNAGRLI